MRESSTRELDAAIAAYDALRRCWDPGSSRTPSDVDAAFGSINDAIMRLRTEIGSALSAEGEKGEG